MIVLKSNNLLLELFLSFKWQDTYYNIGIDILF